MLVIGSSDHTIIVSVTETEIEEMKKGNLATCFLNNPMIVKNLLLIYAASNEQVIKQIEAIGIELSDSMRQTILESKRTDAVAGM